MEETLCTADVREPAMSVGGLSSGRYTICFTFPKFIVLSLDRSENIVPFFCQNSKFSYCYGWLLNVECFCLDGFAIFPFDPSSKCIKLFHFLLHYSMLKDIRNGTSFLFFYFLPDVHLTDVCSRFLEVIWWEYLHSGYTESQISLAACKPQNGENIGILELEYIIIGSSGHQIRTFYSMKICVLFELPESMPPHREIF